MRLRASIINRLKLNRSRLVTEHDLIRREAVIGGQLFGPVPFGHTRQFFCLDDRTWVWYEGWNDEMGKHHSITTRYEVRPDGIIKAQDGKVYAYVNEREAQNLLAATRLYRQEVSSRIYGQSPSYA